MKTRAIAAAALTFSLLLASSVPGAESEGYQLRAGADWRFYGINSSKTGFGPDLELSKTFLANGRTEITAGGRVAWYPNQKAYSWTNGSRTVGMARENRILYAGIPLTVRHYFSGSRLSPFAEIQNRLDVRVLQRTENGRFETVCFGTFQQTCVEDADYHETSANNLLVWRQTVAAGLRIRLRKTSILWSEGIQWEVTPGREAAPYGPPARGIFLGSSLGFSF